MALNRLGKIIVTDDYNTWSSGDVIISYFNDSTEAIEVTKNDVTVTSGELLLVQPSNQDVFNGSYYRRVNDNFTYTYSNGEISNFDLDFEFPYFKEVAVTNDVEGTNDLKIKSVTIVKATDKSANDATVSIDVTSANTPIEWSLSEFNYGNGTASASSITTYAGNYTIRAIDSLGYKVTKQIYVGYALPSYGVKWEFQEQSRNGDKYKTEILERSYVSSSSEVTASEQGFKLSVRGEGKDFYDTQILASNASLSLVSDTAGKYVDIARDGDEEKYQVKRYKLVSAVWTLEWQGFITPSSYSEEYGQTPYITTFSVHDRLGDLKNLKFLNDADENDNSITDYSKLVIGEISQFQALNFCLSKLNQGFGYRVVLPIFEASHSTSNTTPLSQTYFTPDFYANIKNNDYNPDNCDMVVKDILKTYQAHIQARDGYWYIISWEALLSSSVSYVEYDSALAYVGTGSWNPIVDFKLPEQTSRWRWMGGKQDLSFTEVFKKVNLKINTKPKENGSLLPFNETTIQYPYPNNEIFKGIPTGFEGVSLITGNYIAQSIFKKETSTDYNYSWNFKINDTENSSSYLFWSGSLEYSGTDNISISADIEPTTLYEYAFSSVFPLVEQKELDLPYITLKWSFELDGKYLTNGGNWSDAAVINEYFLDKSGEQNFKIESSYRDVAVTTGDYKLKIYIPTMYENHFSNTSRNDMFTSFRDLPTTTVVSGARRICRHGAYNTTGSDLVDYSIGYSLYFYELRLYDTLDTPPAESVPEVIEPDDYDDDNNKVKWILVKKLSYNSFNAKPISFSMSNFKLKHLPGGLEPDEENTISQINNINNKLELDYELNLYDLTDDVTNDENIYVNYLKKSDSSPTTVWTKTGESVTKTIQKQVLDRIVGLTKVARYRIQGSFISDTQITSLNVLRDPNDNNRIYYPTGVTFDDYKDEYNGEVLELGSDDVVTSSAHSTGHKNSAHT